MCLLPQKSERPGPCTILWHPAPGLAHSWHHQIERVNWDKLPGESVGAGLEELFPNSTAENQFPEEPEATAGCGSPEDRDAVDPCQPLPPGPDAAPGPRQGHGPGSLGE